MSTESLGERGKALEGKFFHDREQEQISKLRDKRAKEAAVAELAEITGFGNPDTLRHLVDIGVTPMTLTAFSIVPLLHVAWCDRKLDDAERKAILVEATDMGIKSTAPAYKLLESWLTERPNPELFEAWKTYHRELVTKMDADSVSEMRRKTLERAEQVARASGGLLGLGAVSGEEREALRELREILDGA